MPVIVKVNTDAARQSAQSPAQFDKPHYDKAHYENHQDNNHNNHQSAFYVPHLPESAFYVTDDDDSDRDVEGLDFTALPYIFHHDDSTSQKDVVVNGELQKVQTNKSQNDPKLVKWQGADDPENPKNWTTKKKWASVFVVPCFTLISPVASSMLAPALTSMGKDLHIDNSIVLEMTLSIFVLAYAIGPLFFGPLSEIYGRSRVLQCANLIYIAFNTACGFCNSKGQMILFRFLAGIGGSAPLSIGGGVMSDCFRAEERGKAMAIYSLGPLLGPAIGPVAGGFISEYTTWRWCFWATSIVALIIQVAGFFFIKETYAPTLLHRKAKKLRKETGDPSWHTEYENPQRSLANTLSVSMRRPFVLIATQPIVQALAVFMAYVYGLMYLMLASFPDLWTSPEYYNESVATGGLNYFSLAVGFFIGAQLSAQLNDRIYKKLTARNKGVGLPEFRTPLLFIGACLLPVGLFIYGWTAQSKVHWIAPNIGVAILCMATIMSFQCIQVYLVDTYTRYAASALAAAVLLRSLAGFGFPLFAPYLFKKLHYGWGNSLLAFVAIGLGVPAPLLLWKFGAKLRNMSPYAAG